MKAKKHTIKTDAEFLSMVDKLAGIQMEHAAKKAARDAEINAVHSRHAEVDKLEEEADKLHEELEAYITQPGVAARLLPDGKKTASTAKATFSLRCGKPTVVPLEGGTEQEIIERLEQAGKTEWLKAGKLSMNKAAIQGAGMTADELAEWGIGLESKTELKVKPKGSK